MFCIQHQGYEVNREDSIRLVIEKYVQFCIDNAEDHDWNLFIQLAVQSKYFRFEDFKDEERKLYESLTLNS
jgi:hypothetical protein